MRCVGLVLFCSLAFALPVSAQDQPRPRGGTHKLLELGLGLTLGGEARPAASLLVGHGAKLKGTPLRVYLIGELGYSMAHRQGVQAVSDERSDLLLAAGMRVYVAAPDRWRFFFDIEAGTSRSWSELALANGPLVRSEAWSPALSLAGGLQYRVLYELSVGLRVRWLAAADGLRDVREVRGEPRFRPWSSSAVATWHF